MNKKKRGNIMITNFRDIGGTTLKKGYFFRSGQLTDLEQKDIDFLKNTCKLSKIYDMRSQPEISSEPDTKIPFVPIENIDILGSATSETNASLQDMLLNVDNIKEAMLSTYKELVVSDSALKGYSLFLNDILEEDAPVLFHCFAGKDRTGFGAALLLKISGATDDEIMEDYLLTNESRKKANEDYISSMKNELSPQQLAALPVALTVDKSYLEYANKVMKETFGDFKGYLSKGLKLKSTFAEEFNEKFALR